MNNGVNNSELSIEPVVEPVQPEQTTAPQTAEPAPVEIAPAAPQPQPTIQPETVPAVPQPQPTIQPEVATPQPQPEPEQSLGSNVKVAPVQPMYDENDNVIAQPEPTPRPEIVQPTPPVPGEPPQVQIKEETTTETAETKPEEVQPVAKKRRLSL